QRMRANLLRLRSACLFINIPFLDNVMMLQEFLAGEYRTTFIDRTPELFVLPKRKDRGTKMLRYIGYTTVNGFEGFKKKKKPQFAEPPVPKIDHLQDIPAGRKQIFEKKRPDGLTQCI